MEPEFWSEDFTCSLSGGGTSCFSVPCLASDWLPEMKAEVVIVALLRVPIFRGNNLLQKVVGPSLLKGFFGSSPLASGFFSVSASVFFSEDGGAVELPLEMPWQLFIAF